MEDQLTEMAAINTKCTFAGLKTKVVTPEVPEAKLLAENFMNILTKIWHTSLIENKNLSQEINKFLRQDRATPHATTGLQTAQ